MEDQCNLSIDEINLEEASHNNLSGSNPIVSDKVSAKSKTGVPILEDSIANDKNMVHILTNQLA